MWLAAAGIKQFENFFDLVYVWVWSVYQTNVAECNATVIPLTLGLINA